MAHVIRSNSLSKGPPIWNINDVCRIPSQQHPDLCLTEQRVCLPGPKVLAAMLEFCFLQLPVHTMKYYTAVRKNGWEPPAGWRPREGLMLQLESEGIGGSSPSSAGTSLFSPKADWMTPIPTWRSSHGFRSFEGLRTTFIVGDHVEVGHNNLNIHSHLSFCIIKTWSKYSIYWACNGWLSSPSVGVTTERC